MRRIRISNIVKTRERFSKPNLSKGTIFPSKLRVSMFFTYTSTKQCAEQCARELHKVSLSDPEFALIPISKFLAIIDISVLTPMELFGAMLTLCAVLVGTCNHPRGSLTTHGPMKHAPPRQETAPYVLACLYAKGTAANPHNTPPVILCKHIGGCFNGPINHPPHQPGNEIFTIAGAIAGAIVGVISGIGSAHHHHTTTPATTTTTIPSITTTATTTTTSTTTTTTTTSTTTTSTTTTTGNI